MWRLPGVALLAVLLATGAMARDGALSLGLTAPPTALLEPGMSLGWQETLGRRLVLGLGVGVSEPRPDDRKLSLVGRFSLPTDAGFNQRWYPWIGVDQPLPASRDKIDAAQWQAGFGLERFFLPEIAGFAELRWQPELKETLHAQLGLRFWPGRLNRLDARLRDSEPVQPKREAEGFAGPIVLNTTSTTEPGTTGPVAARPVQTPTAGSATDELPSLTMQAAPEGDPIAVSHIGVAEVSEPSPALQRGTENGLPGVDSLASGTYVHLGLFREDASVQRLRSQLEPNDRAQSQVAYDAEAGGYRVVLGPFTETRATEQRARLAGQGIDSFLYRRD